MGEWGVRPGVGAPSCQLGIRGRTISILSGRLVRIREESLDTKGLRRRSLHLNSEGGIDIVWVQSPLLPRATAPEGLYKHAPTTTPTNITPAPTPPPVLPPPAVAAVAVGPVTNKEVAIVPTAVYAALVSVGNTSPLTPAQTSARALSSLHESNSPLSGPESKIARNPRDRDGSYSRSTRERGDYRSRRVDAV